MPLLARFLLIAVWLAWIYPFLFRAPHRQKRASIVRATPTVVGLGLESFAIFLAFSTGARAELRPGALRITAAAILGSLSVAMAWAAVRHLGRQFRVSAGLYEDHALVTTGPYAIVRHPIYCALLGMLLFTLLLLAPWQRTLLPVLLYLAGTEIRVRTEDALLASRFGEVFSNYQARIPAYLPFVR
jgi:protein-S-isoprenylcysteine O-methyltransferase Ste14